MVIRFGHLAHILGIIFIVTSVAMIPSFVFSFLDNDHYEFDWFISILLLLFLGSFIHRFFRIKGELNYRECFFTVTLSWIFLAFCGALPYLFTQTLGSWVDAFFESASGFTTTGATVITDLAPLPRSILFWRSLTNWLGGMGVIVLSVSILPLLGVGGTQLFNAEAPGPLADKLTPRIASTAKILWKIYLIFTCLEIIILFFAGLPLFEAVCHSFSTLATGGFSIQNKSVMAYNNFFIECVTMVFMLLASINFGLHYRFLKRRKKAYRGSSECKFYLLLLFFAFVIIGWNTYQSVYKSFFEMFRFVSFQIFSISSTTGFVSDNFDHWPNLSKSVLVILMLVGGCSGSTSGGIKALRIFIVIKFVLKELRRLIYPRAVLRLKFSEKILDKDILNGVLAFFALSIFVLMFCISVMSCYEKDFLTAFTSVIACFCNIGPGLAKVGAVENYADISQYGKFLLTICMIMGRLELFTVVVLFLPGFWKK